jgi:hypothetical protein
MTAVEQQREAVEAWFLMTAISCAFEPGRITISTLRSLRGTLGWRLHVGKWGSAASENEEKVR